MALSLAMLAALVPAPLPGAFADVTAAGCDVGSNDLGGMVSEDFNNNGVRDGIEPGSVDGVTVTAYDDAGQIADMVAGADGSFIFAGIFAANASVRLEFSGPA